MKKIMLYNSPLQSFLLCMVILLFSQCEQKYELDLSLAVNTEEMHLEAVEGKTKILVYADDKWDVSVKEETDWLSLDRTSGSGNGDVLFSYAQNFGVSRSATLVIRKGNQIKEVKILQAGMNASFRFSKSKYTVTKNPFHITLPIINDLKSNVRNIQIEYLYDDETSEKWVTNAKLTESGFEFDLLENNAGRNRTVRLYLTVIDGLDNEYTVFADVDQSQSNPTLTQRTAESLLTKRAKLDTVIVRGNVGALFPEFETNVTYEQGSGWIEQVELANDSLLIIAVRSNESGLERRANVNIKLINNGTTYIDLTHKVIQSADDFEYLTFEDLKARIPGATGSIIINAPLTVLEGVVLSDAGSMNLDTNPNTVFNNIDFTEGPKTGYLQNANGTSGIRLKFVNVAANSLKRYNKVLLSVNGLTLVKEANPTRYTIRGVTGGSIVKVENGTVNDVILQTKTINELIDNDVYTFVRLRDVSIAVPYGSYVNVNMGYVMKSDWNTDGTTTPYVDAVPTAVFDKDGGSLKMLVNTANSWSRDALPTGTGMLSGVVVHSKLVRYGAGEGEIGRYSIRPVTKADIDLYETQQANTLVEWRMFNPNNLGAGGTLTANNGGYAAALGTGKLSATSVGTATLGANPIFHTDRTSKVVPTSAFQFNAKWWNPTTNKGEGIVTQFATTGVSARTLMVNFNIGGGSGSVSTLNVPVYWEVAYSLDGTNYTVLPNSTFYTRPLAGWGFAHNFTANGLNPYSFKLPNSLLGQPNVYVKLQAQSNICGSNTLNGGEGGRITATENTGNVNVRFGTVSIQYIQ